MIRSRTLAALLAVIAVAACDRGTEAEPAPADVVEAPARAPQTQPIASPRDTARATVGGAEILVDHGRPYMRGRTIMGGLVPYGEVWRTGANEATHLVTTTDLSIGDVAVPAGTYTLYTLPTASAWTLIVNRQTGQWGTQYDQGQDLARIPMRVSATPDTVDQFTIAIEPHGEGAAVLAMTWETTRAEVPLSVTTP
jgi:hypothetical protein